MEPGVSNDQTVVDTVQEIIQQDRHVTLDEILRRHPILKQKKLQFRQFFQ